MEVNKTNPLRVQQQITETSHSGTPIHSSTPSTAPSASAPTANPRKDSRDIVIGYGLNHNLADRLEANNPIEFQFGGPLENKSNEVLELGILKNEVFQSIGNRFIGLNWHWGILASYIKPSKHIFGEELIETGVRDSDGVTIGTYELEDAEIGGQLSVRFFGFGLDLGNSTGRFNGSIFYRPVFSINTNTNRLIVTHESVEQRNGEWFTLNKRRVDQKPLNKPWSDFSIGHEVGGGINIRAFGNHFVRLELSTVLGDTARNSSIRLAYRKYF